MINKTFILLLFTCILYDIQGQDTIFLDSNKQKIETFKEAAYFKLIEKKEEKRIIEKVFQESGQLVAENQFIYNKKNKKIKDGKSKKWYKNGQIKFDINYKNGKYNGYLLSYWENSNLKRKDFYKKGKLKSGICFDKNGNKVKYYDYIIKPKFPGGENQLYQFLRNNIKYPPSSLIYNLEGRVIIKFVVEIDGTIRDDIEVIESVNYELDEEAIRIIKSMPKWKPGKVDGGLVRFWFTLPIVYKIDRPETKIFRIIK